MSETRLYKERMLIETLQRIDREFGLDLQPRGAITPLNLVEAIQTDPTLRSAFDFYLSQPPMTMEMFFIVVIKTLFLQKAELLKEKLVALELSRPPYTLPEG